MIPNFNDPDVVGALQHFVISDEQIRAQTTVSMIVAMALASTKPELMAAYLRADETGDGITTGKAIDMLKDYIKYLHSCEKFAEVAICNLSEVQRALRQSAST